jgi:hypothetical protein
VFRVHLSLVIFLILSIQLLHAGGEAEDTILNRPIRRELERYTDSGYFRRLGVGVNFPYAVTEEKGELFDETRYLYTTGSA